MKSQVTSLYEQSCGCFGYNSEKLELHKKYQYLGPRNGSKAQVKKSPLYLESSKAFLTLCPTKILASASNNKFFNGKEPKKADSRSYKHRYI